MFRFIVTLGFIFLLPVIAWAQAITVAVTANMQPAFEALKGRYESTTGIRIKAVFSSSGTLTAQIENGAPFDVFLSADMKYPQAVFEKGFALAQPQVYAYGALILWTLRDLDLTQGMESLLDRKVKKIALANPQSAPYGAAAVKAMKESGLYYAIEKKLVYGESIAQVNQFVGSGGADIGFTAQSTVMPQGLKAKGRWVEVDKKFYEPIAQGVVILKHAEENNFEAARNFYDFLFSKGARAILKPYGYQLP